jgi:hypothetical protein
MELFSDINYEICYESRTCPLKEAIKKKLKIVKKECIGCIQLHAAVLSAGLSDTDIDNLIQEESKLK